jgi:N6-adenosine-specific RNA methylase IME4
MNELTTQSWYQSLLADLKKLEFTGIVLTKWNIGKRILEDIEKFGKSEYGSKRIENLAKDLNVSGRDLWYCKQFAEKYPKTATPLQNLSWREAIKLLPERKQEKKLEIIELPVGKYDVVLADPPWKYDFAPSSSTQIEQHYDTMETEDICKLKIPSANNSVLFLWATAPKLEHGLKVLNAWGFEYKTCGVWDKITKGMGYWFLGQHELLLIGTKGNFSPPETSNRVSSVYSEKKGKHSKKPDYYYQLIERMFPNGKYLELFARKKYDDKWTVWGNEC